MIDQIEQLAERIEYLMRLLDEARKENRELRQTNDALTGQLTQVEQIAEQKRELEQHIMGLESEMENMAHRESQIRERLHTILARIDTIESEVGANGVPPEH